MRPKKGAKRASKATRMKRLKDAQQKKAKPRRTRKRRKSQKLDSSTKSVKTETVTAPPAGRERGTSALSSRRTQHTTRTQSRRSHRTNNDDHLYDVIRTSRRRVIDDDEEDGDDIKDVSPSLAFGDPESVTFSRDSRDDDIYRNMKDMTIDNGVVEAQNERVNFFFRSALLQIPRTMPTVASKTREETDRMDTENKDESSGGPNIDMANAMVGTIGSVRVHASGKVVFSFEGGVEFEVKRGIHGYFKQQTLTSRPADKTLIDAPEIGLRILSHPAGAFS